MEFVVPISLVFWSVRSRQRVVSVVRASSRAGFVMLATVLCSCSSKPGSIHTSVSEEELVTTSAVSAIGSAAPATANSGGEVSLSVKVSSTRATIADVRVEVVGPSGASVHKLALAARSLAPASPLEIADTFSLEPSDPAGSYTVWATARHSGTGKLLLDRTSVAQFKLNCADCTSGSVVSGWLSGVAVSPASTVLDGSFGAWRGRAVEIAGTWDDLSFEQQSQLPTLAPGGEWANWPGALDVAVGGIYKQEKGDTWAAAAHGDYEPRWRELLTRLEAQRRGKGPTYIRFAQEFNGDWWPDLWMVTPAEVNDFKAAWQRFHRLKQELFADAKLVWCPADRTSSGIADARSAFPGAAYVDLIGIDTYNQWPFAASDADVEAKWTATENGAPAGPEPWRQFAEAQGLPFALCEWGSAGRDQGGGGGDSPAYVQHLHDWVAAHAGSGAGQVVYEILYEVGQVFELYPQSVQPLAAQAYKNEWSP
jgi:hypothetical protein